MKVKGWNNAAFLGAETGWRHTLQVNTFLPCIFTGLEKLCSFLFRQQVDRLVKKVHVGWNRLQLLMWLILDVLAELLWTHHQRLFEGRSLHYPVIGQVHECLLIRLDESKQIISKLHLLRKDQFSSINVIFIRLIHLHLLITFFLHDAVDFLVMCVSLLLNLAHFLQKHIRFFVNNARVQVIFFECFLVV